MFKYYSILYYVVLINISNITSIKSPKMKREIVHTPFNPIFFMLLAEKSPKHKGLLLIDILLWL